jgi:hypothetical protein
MRIRNIAIAAASVAAFGSAAAVGVAAPAAPSAPTAPAAQAGTRQVEGTVTAINRGARTFRLRDSQRGPFTIKVTGRTTWQRVGSFSALRVGMTRIEANIRRSGGQWVATHVERSGGGGRHGGGGSDDS